MSGRAIIVTGGFGVLGRAVADVFAAQGDRVARVDYAPAPAAALPGGLDLGGADLSQPAGAHDAVTAVVDALGGVDVLVNVAGGFIWQSLEDDTGESWPRMFALNALTCRNMCAAAQTPLKAAASGRIVNIGAFGAISAAAGMGSYAASKAAVHKLTESLAAELRETSITVNAVLPTIIDTPTNRADMPDADPSQWVQPLAIAEVISFLASPAARAITGALIPVSRGG